MNRDQAKICAEEILSAFDQHNLGQALDDHIRNLCNYVLQLQKGRVELTLQEFQGLVDKKNGAIDLLTYTAATLNNFLRDA